MEVSNKKYGQMAKDFKKADKIYSEVKTKSYKGDHGCPQPSEKQDYDYMKGIKTSPVYVSGGLKPRKGTM